MIIKNGDAYLGFSPVDYEFPRLTKEHREYDEVISNWINVRFEYPDNRHKKRTEMCACILTFEIESFIFSLKQLVSGQIIQAQLDAIEPYFNLSAYAYNKMYVIHAKYQTDEDILYEVEQIVGKEQLTDFLIQFEEEFSSFPVR
ncbi:MAG: hypothetical protein IJL63_02605 [Clostridia bacterium]|nr:hypothetical protein [Clostridia bacterium]